LAYSNNNTLTSDEAGEKDRLPIARSS
jgi:hypothetical protein